MPTQPTHTWSQLKPRLKDLEKDKLLPLLHDLYNLNADNRLYLSTRFLAGTSEEMVAPYRRIIKQVFNPDRGVPSLNLSAARKALNDLKKLCNDRPAVVDLMLFYVEQGVICTRTYGDIDAPFYVNLETVYADAAELTGELHDQALTAAVLPRFKRILRDTDGIGWGFHDTLTDIYCDAFAQEDDL